jgi:hypothetical protein
VLAVVEEQHMEALALLLMVLEVLAAAAEVHSLLVDQQHLERQTPEVAAAVAVMVQMLSAMVMRVAQVSSSLLIQPHKYL